MSIDKLEDGRYRVRWYTGGRGSTRKSKTFTLERDAKRWQRKVDQAKELGDLASLDAGKRPVADLAVEWWDVYAEPNLADNTLTAYQRMLDSFVIPRLGKVRVRDVKPGTVADFRRRLERNGVGRDSVRKSMVVLQAMFRYAEQSEDWGVVRNPVRVVQKPSGRRERDVVCLAPAQVEAIRTALIDQGYLADAVLVSLVAYQGLRCPEEVTALEWGHVGRQTLRVKQRNIDGELVARLKNGRPERLVDLAAPVKQDLAEHRLRMGRPQQGLVFPRPDGKPWRGHDWNNWRRRVWKKARTAAGVPPLPPYDLRHAFASLQIRAGVSIPELAEQMGHSPQMTVGTYTHVIRDLKGEPVMSAEDQIVRAREGKRERSAVSR